MPTNHERTLRAIMDYSEEKVVADRLRGRSDTVAVLRRILGSRDPLMRYAAVGQVGSVHDPVQRAALLRRALDDREQVVRLEALETVRGLRVRTLAETIVVLARNDADHMVRGYAALALPRVLPRANAAREVASLNRRERNSWTRVMLLRARFHLGQDVVAELGRAAESRVHYARAMALTGLIEAGRRRRFREAVRREWHRLHTMAGPRLLRALEIAESESSAGWLSRRTTPAAKREGDAVRKTETDE